MTVYLLDVNVLIALIDAEHLHHPSAASWFAALGRTAWATCPLTENGVARIMGSPRYRGSPGPPGEIVRVLDGLRRSGGHVFWPDVISIADVSHVDATRLAVPGQVTDTYLLALARHNGGKLATFDRRLVTGAVSGGRAHLEFLA